MIRISVILAVASALIASAPAQSQSRRELSERIDATEVRIGELETQFLAGDPVAEALMQRFDALDYQVREMTGEVERLSFENRQLRNQVEALEARLAEAESPVEPAIDGEAAAWMNEGLAQDEVSGATQLGTAEPQSSLNAAQNQAVGVLGAAPIDAAPVVAPADAFAAARARLLDGDFGGAQTGFEDFVARYGEDPLASEALYWLGETHFVRNNYTEAADQYIASLRMDAAGARAPDALVRLAASMYSMGRGREACDTLARFGRQFPNASQASRDRAARESVRANCR